MLNHEWVCIVPFALTQPVLRQFLYRTSRLLAGPLCEDSRVKPTDGDVGVSGSVADGIDQQISARVIVNIDEPLRSLEQREDVQLGRHGSSSPWCTTHNLPGDFIDHGSGKIERFQ
jgi:hypothetical protein